MPFAGRDPLAFFYARRMTPGMAERKFDTNACNTDKQRPFSKEWDST